jgi:hypothetical protein
VSSLTKRAAEKRGGGRKLLIKRPRRPCTARAQSHDLCARCCDALAQVDESCARGCSGRQRGLLRRPARERLITASAHACRRCGILAPGAAREREPAADKQQQRRNERGYAQNE